jgi:hypothetical protein
LPDRLFYLPSEERIEKPHLSLLLNLVTWRAELSNV